MFIDLSGHRVESYGAHIARRCIEMRAKRDGKPKRTIMTFNSFFCFIFLRRFFSFCFVELRLTKMKHSFEQIGSFFIFSVNKLEFECFTQILSWLKGKWREKKPNKIVKKRRRNKRRGSWAVQFEQWPDASVQWCNLPKHTHSSHVSSLFFFFHSKAKKVTSSSILTLAKEKNLFSWHYKWHLVSNGSHFLECFRSFGS